MKKLCFLAFAQFLLGIVQMNAQSFTVSVSVTANVNCNGGSTGKATATVSGGTAPFTYSWNPSTQKTASVTGLSAGTYTVEVSDKTYTVAPVTIVITQPIALTVTASTTANINCHGVSTGSMSATPTGGTSPYTYSWSSPGGSTATKTGLSAGTYTITITDKNSCTATASSIVTQPGALTVSTSVTSNLSCNGVKTGSVSSSVTGGTLPYTYSWTGGGTSSTYTGLSAGTYTITVKDNCGASSTASISVTQPTALTVTASTTANVSCNGSSNGSVSSTVTGGTSPYTYSWSGSGTSSTKTGLSAGTYTITVTDNHGCVATATANVTQPVALSASLTTVNILCNGGSTGSATVTASGGKSPYTYSWSGSGTTTSKTGLSAGTYSITVKDNCGASFTASTTITQPVALSISLATVNITCHGGTTGSATVTASGGKSPYTYTWSGSGTTASKTGLSAGTYSITVKDNCGASATASVIVTQPAVLTVLTSSIPSCNGTSNGSVSATPSGGTSPYTYSWSGGGTSSIKTGLSTGTYTITLKDNCGASATASVIITEPAALIVSASTTANISCNGGNTGSISSTPSGGTTPYTYSWSGGGTNSTKTGLSAGTYTITVTDNHDCSATASIILTQPLPIAVTATSIANVNCNGGSTGSASATASGGTVPYTYLWSPNGGTNVIASNLGVGVYTITVTDNHGCSNTQTVNITESPSASITITASSMAVIPGSSDVLTASGASTYNWSTGATTSTITVTPFSTATYTVTGINSNGCSGSANITINTIVYDSIVSKPVFACGAGVQAIKDINNNIVPHNYAGVFPDPATISSWTSWVSDGYPVITCGPFAIYYDDLASNTGTGFDDQTVTSTGVKLGQVRQNTYCGVLTYIASIFNFGNLAAGDYIRIHMSSWEGTSAPPSPYEGAFGLGSPIYPSFAASSINDGNVFDHTVTGTTINPQAFDGAIWINFTGNTADGSGNLTPFSWLDDYTQSMVPCDLDLYSVLLHETTHTMGWISLVDVDPNTRVPYSSVGPNAYSLFDHSYLYQANSMLSYQNQNPTFTQIITNSWTAPQISAGLSPVQANIWLNNYGQFGGTNKANLNQPVYSGAPPGYIGGISFISFMSHMDATYLSWTDRASASPGYQPPYLMGPYSYGGETRRTYTLPELRALLQMVNQAGKSYSLLNPTTNTSINGVATNGALISNHPPVNTEQNTSGNLYGNYVFPDSYYDNTGSPIQQPVDNISNPIVNNGSAVYTYSVNADPYIISPNGNQMYIVPGTLYNIRGSSIPNITTGGNNHNALSLNSNNTILTYSPRPDFLGLAQIGFYVADNLGEQSVFVTKTFEVIPASTWTNTANQNTPSGTQYGSELVLNGGYEQGTEVKTFPNNEFDPNTSLLNSWREGDYFLGATMADSHPLDFVSQGGWSSSYGEIIYNSYLECYSGNAFPEPFGGNPFTSPDLAWNIPTPDGLGAPSNSRFHWLDASWNYLMINNSAPNYNPNTSPEKYCTYYTVTLDVNFAQALHDNPSLTTYYATIGFTNKISYPSAPIADFWVPITIPVNHTTSPTPWQTITTGFYYCGNISSTGPWYINLDGSATPLSSPSGQIQPSGDGTPVFLDNVSLVVNSNPPPLTVTAIATPTAVCIGYSSTLSTTLTNQGCSQTYKWEPGTLSGSSVAVTPTVTTVYTCTVTDDCAGTATTTVIVNVNTPPIVNTTIYSNVSCNGGNNGSATTNPTGGKSPYSYLWNPSSQTSQTATGLSAGTYSIAVTDANGCVGTNLVVITQPASIGVSFNSTTATCGQNNGSSTVTPTGGVSPYTYLWTPTHQTSSVATGLSAGYYTVTVTDNHGCTYTTITGISNTGAQTVNVTGTNINCFGYATGTANATVSGGSGPYTYLWKPEGQTTASVTGLIAGVYSVQVTGSNGCITIVSVNITQLPLLTTNITSSTNILCNGALTGSASSTTSGGTSPYTYVWQPGSNHNNNITGVSAGTYSLTVTDKNGCIATTNVIITQTPALTVTFTSVAYCYATSSSATAIVTGGTAPYTYFWQLLTGPYYTYTTSSISIGQGSPFSVTITDANGCTATGYITTPTRSMTTVSAFPTGNGSCFGGLGSAATSVSGGMPPYTYSWSGGAGTNATATGLLAGTYTVTVTDQCSEEYDATATVVITQASGLSASANTIANVSCNGENNGSALSTVSGGSLPYTYLWSDGSSQTTTTATGLSAGTYTITVTDQCYGEIATASVIITQPSLLSTSVTVLASISCYGENNVSASSIVSGGTFPYTYSWSGSGGTNATTTGLSAGTYTLSVTDKNGCISSATFIITQPSLLSTSTSIISNAGCIGNNGSVTANPTGGTSPYSYSWNTSPTQTTQIATGLSVGTYTVTVTDKNGCIAKADVIISQATQLSVTVTPTLTTVCAGVCPTITAVASGGSGAYTYSWMPGNGTSSSYSPCPNSNTTYTVSVANGSCPIATATTTIDILPLPTVSVTASPTAICSGGSSVLTATGGISYVWSTGSTTNPITVIPTTSTTYTVTGYSKFGDCSNTATVTVAVDNLSVSSATNSPIDLCEGSCGNLSVSVSGGVSPYTYMWTPATWLNSTTAASPEICPPLNATPGSYNYTAEVTDANGCSGSATDVVIVNAGPPVPIISGSATGCGGIYSVSNIAAGATYTWTTTGATSTPTSGTGSSTLPNAVAFSSGGTITFTATYTTGCTSSATYTVQPCCTSTTYDLVIGTQNASQIIGGSAFSNETILVNGTLTVDQTTSFDNCIVQFTPGSEITIEAGQTLSIGADGCTHFYAACNSMWQGIVIQPNGTFQAENSNFLIEDAVNAIWVSPSATVPGLFTLTGVVFNRNYEDIVINATAAEYEGSANGCVFTCRDLSSLWSSCSWSTYANWDNATAWPNSANAELLAPYLGDRSHIGIELTNVTNIHGYTAMGDCYFDTHDYGIYSTGSNLGVYTNTFQNITGSGFEAIHASTSYLSGPQYAIEVGRPAHIAGQGNTFLNCNIGVAVGYSNNVSIQNNTFNNSAPGNAPFVYAIDQGEHCAAPPATAGSISIESNTINNATVGIRSFSNSPSTGDIYWNAITNTVGTSTWSGINVMDNPKALYSIQANTINMTGTGITVSGVGQSYVNYNNITLNNDGVFNSGVGISYTNGGSASQIADNNITVPDGGRESYTGIFEAQTPSTDIRCNTIFYPNLQIQSDAASSVGTTVNVNAVNAGATTTAVGTEASNGSIIHGGGLGFYSLDSWTGTFKCNTTMVPAATIPLSSIYVPSTSNCSGTAYPACGTGSCIYFAAPRPYGSGTNTCPSAPRQPPIALSGSTGLDSLAMDTLAGGLVTPFAYPPDSITIALMHSLVLKQVAFENQDTMQAIADEGIVNIVWSNMSQFTSDKILIHFMDSIATTPLGEIMAIDTEINYVVNNPPLPLRSIGLSGLLANNNAITPVNNIEANMQTETSFYLNFLINNDSLSPFQVALLGSLAERCPDIDGPGVYQARVLMSVFNADTVVYLDTCSNTTNTPHRFQTGVSNTSISNIAINIYPNPNNGNFTLEYDLGTETSGKLGLYNMMGEIVGEYNLSGSEGKMNISNPQLSNGVYVWKLYTDTEVVKVGKIIIIK